VPLATVPVTAFPTAPAGEPVAETGWLAAGVAAGPEVPAVPLAVAVTAETVLPAAEARSPAVEVTGPAVPAAAAVTVPVTVPAVLVAAEVTGEAAVTAAGMAEVTAPVVPLTTPETAEPGPPPAGPWVAALAGPASSRPMPNATHRPPIIAPPV
jgi:hypothetical protein